MTSNVVEAHYDGVAGTATTRASRCDGPAYALKSFHNEQKRLLLEHCVPRHAKVLDVACGRGGDVWKYAKLDCTRVVGVDVSGAELEEAVRRAAKARVPFTAVKADARVFSCNHTDFDAATCMFALHYFWESEASAHALFANIARHVRMGGVFVGIVPDGRCIRPVDTDVFKIAMEYTLETATCFGSAYSMTITDTVTDGAGAVREYAVFSNVLQKVAAAHGFVPIDDLPWLTRLPGRVLWHFDPPYGGDWRECSLVYGVFAFRKCA